MFWIIVSLNFDQKYFNTSNWYTNRIISSPFCSNCFCFVLQRQMNTKDKTNMSQFIEDLTAFNDGGQFERYIKKFTIQS